MKVVSLQCQVSLVGRSHRIVDEQLNHHEARLAVHRSRTVGKGFVKVLTHFPLVHVSLLSFLQLVQCLFVGLDARRVGRNVLLQFVECRSLRIHFLLHGAVVLAQVRQQVAQFAFRFRVVRVVRSSAHRTSRTLLQLFAQLHDVVRLAQRVGRANQLKSLLRSRQFGFHFLHHALLLRQLRLFAFLRRSFFGNAFVTLRNVAP